ncbi:MAG TPA: SOS response-associated peptidase family protein [Rhizomicrobium sp.]|nr:SOS response-associated peptidase family protein [Rhizomicrobium sp.]
MLQRYHFDMCGKFTAMASWAEVVDFSQPLGIVTGGNDQVVSFRVGSMIPVIVFDSELQERLVIPMQWGFPHKTKRLDPIHCRSETIDVRPTFAPLFAGGRRGIVVVQTFNEGEEVGKKTIQHVIDPKADAPLGFPVLWNKFDIGGREIFACVQITVPANQLISTITDRMPAFLRPEDWPKWLGEIPATASELKAMLKTVERVSWTMTREEAAKGKKPVVSDPTPGLF